MITAVDLLRGLAALAGWTRREVAGATGYLDTDYAAKGRAAIEEFATSDLVCVHVEAPDEASHQGDAAAKVKAIEEIDAKIATIGSSSAPTIPRSSPPRPTPAAACPS